MDKLYCTSGENRTRNALRPDNFCITCVFQFHHWCILLRRCDSNTPKTLSHLIYSQAHLTTLVSLNFLYYNNMVAVTGFKPMISTPKIDVLSLHYTAKFSRKWQHNIATIIMRKTLFRDAKRFELSLPPKLKLMSTKAACYHLHHTPIV